MNDRRSGPFSVRGALGIGRVIWVAMLFSQAALLVVVLCTAGVPRHRQIGGVLLWFNMGLLLLLVPLGYFIRAQIYKRHWVGRAIAPTGYLSGNLVLWACVEGAGLLGIANAFISGSCWPAAGPTAVAVAIHLVNYPNGLAMQPTNPVLGKV